MVNEDEKRAVDAFRDDIRDERPPEEGASSAAPSEEPVAPLPPDPPRLTRDFGELAQDAARIRARQVEQARRTRRVRFVALGIAVGGIALIVVGAVAGLIVTHPMDAFAPSDESSAVQMPTAEEGDAEGGDDEGGSSSSDADEDADETVSAVEQVVASDQINAAFSSLVANEDGIFDGFVQTFIDDYDSGVNEEVSYTLSDLDVQVQDLSQALLSGFSCSVSNVDVYGQTAWVTLEVTSKSLADQADSFARAVEESDASFADEEEYKAFLRQSYLDAFDSVSPRSHSLLVTIEKDESGWIVTNDVMEYVLGSVWYTSA